MEYEVTDPKGIYDQGKLIPKGGKVTLQKGSRLNALLHFKQVKPVEEKKEESKKK